MTITCSSCGRATKILHATAGLLCDKCALKISTTNDCFGQDLKEAQCYYCFDRIDCGKVGKKKCKSKHQT